MRVKDRMKIFTLKKMMKMYRIIHLFTHYRKFVPEIVPRWVKN